MKVVVAYKWASNPSHASVLPDGTVDWSRAKPAVSEYDPVAIELGRRLIDAAGGELIGMTVGSPDAATSRATKTVLARGLDRTVVVAGEGLDRANPTATAARLAEAIQAVGDVDLVLAGDASVDLGARITPALVAGWLGWPALTDAESIALGAGAEVLVERTTATSVQTLAVPLPAVIAVASGAVTPRVPGMKDILAAGKKPVEVLDAGPEPGLSGSAAVAQRAPAPLPSRHRRVVPGDPDAAARELVDELRRRGVLGK